NGGIVSATGGFYKGNYMGVYDWGSTIYVRGNGSIAITGGEVIATRGSAIGTMRGAVNISGGTVRATTGEAIVNYSSFNGVTLTGGAVFAYGNALSDVVFSSSFVESTGSSLVIAYDKNEETNYVRNSATDLAVWPSLSPAAAMYWALQDGVPGIYYTREGNEGFIAVPEISIVETELPYDPLYVELDHQLYALTFDTPPRFLNGQILAPFRPFGELLGYTVTWDAATSSISMEKPGSTIEMALGDRFCTVNGARFDLTTEPEAIDGRTFIPLYAFRSVGYAIAWDNEKSVLVITSPPNTLVMPYTIAFHANQGTGSMQSQIVLRSGDYTIATNAFTRAEYRFTGWNTAANGSGVSYAPEAMITDIQSDITLYAQWQLIIRVPGDVNSDGAVDMADILLIYQHFRGRVQLTGEELNAADVNGDGKVDMADVLFVYHHFRGIS
ncbi:MAG: stalk domain-containing protein, partial [Clostridiales bacterium]|nr:stalk domain-containing protein [Clostridiales bacterium]